MAYCSSYYLYQRYEMRGGQEPIPSYPNVYSIDGEGSMPLRTRAMYDEECGYIPDVQTIYKWNKASSSEWECVGVDKHYVEYYQYSNDGGITWQNVEPVSSRTSSSVIEYNSQACGYTPPTPGPVYRWVQITPTTDPSTYYCDDCDSAQYSTQYLTFEALENGTFSFNGRSGNTYDYSSIQYSLDSGNTWSTLGRNVQSPTVLSGQKIMWKENYSKDNYPGNFSSTGRYSVEGNILSLYYGDNFANYDTYIMAKSMFESSTGLTSAEHLVLPTKVAGSCYLNMFRTCTHLTTPPNLPAQTLAAGCYQQMFIECVSLTSLPKLGATTLAVTCYYDMFSGCKSLTTIPSNYLPCTNLERACYGWMFFGCSGLTSTPNLPATTLAESCYEGMFADCKSLTTAPDLLAPRLETYCYSNMFRGCSSLNYIKCLATDISELDCTAGWTSWVSATGTFVKASSMSSWTTGANGIPSGWTVTNA